MATYEKAAASTNGGPERSIERLITIDGIARKTAEAMYEIGVRSYADLAQYLSQHTAQQVSAALREHGVNRPPAFIDPAAWARQAREFGKLEDATPTPPEGEMGLTEKPDEAPSRPGVWGHDAVFTVSFDVATDGDQEPMLRTTVHDRTNGGQERVFQGKDTATWVNWILAQAHLPAALEEIAGEVETKAATSPPPVEPNGTRLEIGDVQLSIVKPTADHPEKRLKAEISFRLSGAGAENLASKGIPLRIEGYTVDTESSVSELVASRQSQLEPQVFEYKGQQEFGIPDVGHYEFHSIVLLLPPGELAAYHRGPTLRVIP